MKKSVSLLLTVIMLITMLSFGAIPAEAKEQVLSVNDSINGDGYYEQDTLILNNDEQLTVGTGVTLCVDNLTIEEGCLIVQEGGKLVINGGNVAFDGGSIELNGDMSGWISRCEGGGSINVYSGGAIDVTVPEFFCICVNADVETRDIGDTDRVVKLKAHSHKNGVNGVCWYPGCGKYTASVLSEGNLWIIVAVVAVVGVAALVIVKKKKKPAVAGGTENTDEE